MSAVDVVVPMYNSARWVERAIASVRAQESVEWSLILVDDGSPDDSRARAKRLTDGDKRVRIISQQNRGVCAARNAGARLGRHPYLLFLDADDHLLPGVLADLVDRAGITGAVAVFGDVLGIDEHGAPATLPQWQPPMRVTRWWLAKATGGAVPPEAFLIGTAALPAATLISRRAFDDIGGWDEDLGQYHEDAHLMGRLALVGRVEHLRRPVAAYRLHSGQVSGDPGIESSQRHAFIEKWRTGTNAQQATARIVDGRVVTRQGMLAARRSIRQRQFKRATRFAAGALRAYRPWL